MRKTERGDRGAKIHTPACLHLLLCKNLMVPRGKDGGRDSQGVWDGHGHTAVFSMENQQGPAGQLRELCSNSCGSLDGRGVWGRMDTCTCMAESLYCPPETITMLSISYTPIQTKKGFLKKAAIDSLKKTLMLGKIEGSGRRQ